MAGLPTDSLDEAGWNQFQIRTTHFPGHPQETTENSVDLAHFRYVHGYDNVNRVGAVVGEGPCLESRFDFKSTRRIAKIVTLTLDISSRTRVVGLGYSFVEIREHSVGMDMRMWVLVTPSGRHTHRPVPGLAGAGDTQPKAVVRRHGISPSKAAFTHHEQDHGSHANPGCSAGRGHLEPQDTGPGRSFAFPTAKSCPIEPIALSSIPILVIRRVHSRAHQTALHMTARVRGLEEKLQDGVHRGLAESQ